MEILDYLRSFRIGPFAIFDFTLAYGFVYFIAPYLQKMGLRLSRAQMLWLTLPVSIMVHVAVGSMTPFTKMFLDPYGSYWVKAVIVFMVFMALRKKSKLPL